MVLDISGAIIIRVCVKGGGREEEGVKTYRGG